MIFSCSLRKILWYQLAALSFTSICVAQSTFVEVAHTPYDHQMGRIQPILRAPAGYNFNGLSFALVNEWMIELREMPYRFSRQWRTPSEVESARVGDCKGKALALYDRMQLNGAANLRFVIGRRRISDPVTHAWLEWETKAGTMLLDPTFNRNAELKIQDGRSYVALYGYKGPHKYQAAGTLLARSFSEKRPSTVPARGLTTRPIRSAGRLYSTPRLVDESPIDSRLFLNRTTF
jgi:hypothetical protein